MAPHLIWASGESNVKTGGPKTKNWTTNNSRNWLVSQVAGGLPVRFGGPPTNRDESDWMSNDALVQQIDLALIQSDLISLLLDSRVDDSLVKTCDTGVSGEDADLAQIQIPPTGTIQNQRTALILIEKRGNLCDIELFEKPSFFCSLPPGRGYSPIDEQTVLSARKK